MSARTLPPALWAGGRSPRRRSPPSCSQDDAPAGARGGQGPAGARMPTAWSPGERAEAGFRDEWRHPGSDAMFRGGRDPAPPRAAVSPSDPIDC